MVCKAEIIERIAEFTGQRHAEEWYRALFEPGNTERAIRKFMRNVKDEELYHLTKNSSWKYEDAKEIYTAFSDYFVKGLKLQPKYHPELLVHGTSDYADFLVSHTHYDCKTFEPKEMQINIGHPKMFPHLQTHTQIGNIAHEVFHINQNARMLMWCKRHIWWFKHGFKSRRVRILFALCRPIKPKPLLYWLNQAVYMFGNELYSKQIVEAEAIDIGVRVSCTVLRAWRRFDEDGSEKIPAMH